MQVYRYALHRISCWRGEKQLCHSLPVPYALGLIEDGTQSPSALTQVHCGQTLCGCSWVRAAAGIPLYLFRTRITQLCRCYSGRWPCWVIVSTACRSIDEQTEAAASKQCSSPKTQNPTVLQKLLMGFPTYPIDAQRHIQGSYRTANLKKLHFIYLLNKYRYWIF